jgi:hypothetical protein
MAAGGWNSADITGGGPTVVTGGSVVVTGGVVVPVTGGVVVVVVTGGVVVVGGEPSTKWHPTFKQSSLVGLVG